MWKHEKDTTLKSYHSTGYYEPKLTEIMQTCVCIFVQWPFLTVDYSSFPHITCIRQIIRLIDRKPKPWFCYLPTDQNGQFVSRWQQPPTHYISGVEPQHGQPQKFCQAWRQLSEVSQLGEALSIHSIPIKSFTLLSPHIPIPKLGCIY